MSAEVRQLVVELYQRGEPTAYIKAATGVTGIYPVLRKAGIEPSRTRSARSSNQRTIHAQQAIEALQAAAAHIGSETLRMTDYTQWRSTQNPDAPNLDQIHRFLGRWRTAVHMAGLLSYRDTTTVKADDQVVTKQTITEKDVVDWLQAAATISRLAKREFDAWATSSPDAVLNAGQIDRWFGWASMISKAGLQLAVGGQPQGSTPRWNREEIVAALRDAGGNRYITADTYVRWLREQDGGYPSKRNIVSHYGSWVTACAEAGLKRQNEFSDAQLLADLDAATAELGHHPTIKQYRQWTQADPARVRVDVLNSRYDFKTRALRRR